LNKGGPVKGSIPDANIRLPSIILLLGQLSTLDVDFKVFFSCISLFSKILERHGDPISEFITWNNCFALWLVRILGLKTRPAGMILESLYLLFRTSSKTLVLPG